MIGSTTLQAGRNTAPFDPDEFRDDVLGHRLQLESHHQTRPARRLIALCVTAILVFLVWACVTPVHEVVTGQGALLPADGLRKVQHLEGGIVETVLVRPGQRVEAGDVLLRLDAEQLRLERDKAAARMARLDLSISRLRALAAGDDGPLAGETRGLWESQSDALASARANLATQLQRIAAERESLTRQLPALRRQRSAAERELSLVRDYLGESQDSLDRGLATRFRRDEAARDTLVLERGLAEIEGAETRIASDLAELTAREAELRSNWHREAVDEVAALEAEREETRAQMRQVEDRLSRLEITAPVAGRVNVLGVEGPREVIGAGQVVAEIVPEGEEVYALVEIPASRIGGVVEGSAAQVKVLTYDYTRFGEVAAIVDRVSPGSVVTEDGEQVFEVRLALDTPYVGSAEAGHAAVPGLTVTADIATDTNSLIAYLLKPIRILRDRAFT